MSRRQEAICVEHLRLDLGRAPKEVGSGHLDQPVPAKVVNEEHTLGHPAQQDGLEKQGRDSRQQAEFGQPHVLPSHPWADKNAKNQPPRPGEQGHLKGNMGRALVSV